MVVGADSEVSDRENRPEILDPVLPKEFGGPLQSVHQRQHHDDLATELPGGLDRLQGRPAFGENVVHDDDAVTLLEPTFDLLPSPRPLISPRTQKPSIARPWR